MTSSLALRPADRLFLSKISVRDLSFVTVPPRRRSDLRLDGAHEDGAATALTRTAPQARSRRAWQGGAVRRLLPLLTVLAAAAACADPEPGRPADPHARSAEGSAPATLLADGSVPW